MRICKDCPYEEDKGLLGCVKNLRSICLAMGFKANADKLHCHDVIDVRRCPLGNKERKPVFMGSKWHEGESGIINVSVVNREPEIVWNVDGMYYPRWRPCKRWEICGDVLDERCGYNGERYFVDLRSDGYMFPTVVVETASGDEDYIDLTEDEAVQIKDMLAYEYGIDVSSFDEGEYEFNEE